MKVVLLAHTPDPERVVASAAKLCYSSVGVEELNARMSDEQVQSFVALLSSYGHESPVEHVTFTFGIEGISRACSHQLVRHRIASYSQKSQRYVNEDGFDYIVPPAVAADETALKAFSAAMEAADRAYHEIEEILLAHHKEALMAGGLSAEAAEKKAKKIAIEDARFVLPNACETKIVVTMNVRSLLGFFRQRCCQRAQWEIRDVADEMLRLCKEAAPTLFAKAGPPCVNGPCPEGGMSCGKAKEMRAKYRPESKESEA